MSIKASSALTKYPKISIFVSILFASIILHICAILSYSHFSQSSAYHRLKPLLKTNAMIVIPPVTDKKQILPFVSSDTQLAICRFDTSQNNVVINAILPEQGWSLVLYDKNGTTIYSDVANPYGSSQVDLYLIPDDNRFLGVSLETQIQSNSLNRVLIKADKGLAVLRAQDAGYAYTGRTQEMLKRAICSEEQNAQ